MKVINKRTLIEEGILTATQASRLADDTLFPVITSLMDHDRTGNVHCVLIVNEQGHEAHVTISLAKYNLLPDMEDVMDNKEADGE